MPCLCDHILRLFVEHKFGAKILICNMICSKFGAIFVCNIFCKKFSAILSAALLLLSNLVDSSRMASLLMEHIFGAILICDISNF